MTSGARLRRLEARMDAKAAAVAETHGWAFDRETHVDIDTEVRWWTERASGFAGAAANQEAVAADLVGQMTANLDRYTWQSGDLEAEEAS